MSRDWTKRRQDGSGSQPPVAQTQGIEAWRDFCQPAPTIGASDARESHRATLSSAPVGLAITAAVLIAAVLHAVWNAMAHAIGDQLVGFALIGVAVTVGAAVIVLASPAPSNASWPFLAVSAALHVAHNLLLMRCHRLGEFGQVYPLARGTSTWLVALGAAVFVGEQLSVFRLAGVVIISVGLGTLVFVGGVPTRAARPAITAAVIGALLFGERFGRWRIAATVLVTDGVILITL